MITVRTMGGLGNQMFQYAFGVAQANRLKTSLQIDSRLNSLDSFRPFNLGLFNIPEPVVSGVEGPVVQEKNLLYDETTNSIKDDSVLVGYWQSEKYFQSVASTIRLRFRSMNLCTDEALEHADLIRSKGRLSVMLGIRRGDYVTKQAHANYHGSMPYQYYVKSLDFIRGSLSIRGVLEDPVVFVFSDDVEWVKQNWDFGLETYYWGGDRTVSGHIGREDIDLGLMSLCNNAIIANSSFHWWGAWLGDYMRRGAVIRPEQWFADPVAQAQTGTICPERWFRL